MHIRSVFKSAWVIPFLWLSAAFDAAAELNVTPPQPTVAVGEQTTLSAAGAQGELFWTSSRGRITGSGAQVTYTAPAMVGKDLVIVVDSAGNFKAVVITVELGAAHNFERTKATWEVFSNRSSMFTLMPTSKGTGLWVGTSGGLELREIQTGRLIRLYKNLDGLPENRVYALSSKPPNVFTGARAALWIGTGGGLAQFIDGKLNAWRSEDSPLPGNVVLAVAADEHGGAWVGLEHQGLVYARPHDETWQHFTSENSPLPGSTVYALFSNQRGLWIGTDAGLAVYNSVDWMVYTRNNSGQPLAEVELIVPDGDSGRLWLASSGIDTGLVLFNPGAAEANPAQGWHHFTQDNSGLPANYIKALASDGRSGVWVGTGGGYEAGLGHFDGADAWRVFTKENTDLLSIEIDSLAADGEGGVWVGTFAGGLARVSYSGRAVVFNPGDASTIPSNDIIALESDDEGGVWLGTNPNTGLGGLAHLRRDRSWRVYNQANTGLPINAVEDVLGDGSGGVWISMCRDYKVEDDKCIGGLAHLHANGHWEEFTFSNDNSEIPTMTNLASDDSGGVWVATSNGPLRWHRDGTWDLYPTDAVTTLLNDGDGSVWVGTETGDFLRTPANDWKPNNTGNSDIASHHVRALLGDGRDGIWVGTDANLFYYKKADGSWQRFTCQDAPIDYILALFHDGRGGLWVGTEYGLTHFPEQGECASYDIRNSGLPGDEILDLETDGSGGMWIATRRGGLAHLSFGNRQKLLENVSDEAAREKLLSGKRAAILIHPNGQGSGFSQAETVDFMAAYAYQSLLARGYDHDEIYFLSYRPDLDVNADGQADLNVVDGPVSMARLREGTALRDLTLADVDGAFAWAEEQGELDEPLFVAFIDHGLPDQLLLDPLASQVITSAYLDQLLDQYQTTTGNAAVVLIEACHSGTFVPALSENDRLVISSTDEDFAYYADMGRTSFLKSYMDQLRLGDSFWHALQAVRNTIRTYRAPLNRQNPLLDDSAAGTFAQKKCLNGCFGTLPGILTLTVETPAGTVAPGESVELNVRASLDESSVGGVWASVLTPEAAAQRNAQGYSLMPSPVINLRSGDDNQWQGDFDEFTLSGEYVFSIKARDADGFVTEAPPLTFTVTGGAELVDAAFDDTTGRLRVPAVVVPSGDSQVLLSAELILADSGDPLFFDLDLASVGEGEPLASYATFDLLTGSVFIPLMQMPNLLGGVDTYSATLQLVADTDPLRFSLELGSLKVQP